MSYIHCTMSGWGCRHLLDDRCLRLRKECKPGNPGCVLYGKVVFANDEVEAGKVRRKSQRKKRTQRAERKQGR